MKLICKAKRESMEEVQQFWTQQGGLSPVDQAESKLVQLQAFICQLSQGPDGQAELQRRFERFGDCKRMPGEFTLQFYGRLRRWLDRDIEG